MAAGSAPAQNIVVNPSFELGNFQNRGDGFDILPLGSQAMTGWTVVSDALAWGTTPNSAASVSEIVPFAGAFFLDLQGDGLFGAPYGGVAQTLSTVAGQVYHLSFYLGTQEDPSSPFTHGPISLTAAAGVVSSSFTFAPGGTGTQWGEFGFDFTATDVTTDLTLIGTATSGGAYIGLDLVSVTPAIPEPSSIVLAGTGLVAFASLRRLRRSR